MDFSQVQLIYSAEGNANLVVALPQLKKVLRLPKADISSTRNSKCDNHHQLERQKRPLPAFYGTNPNGVVTTLDMDQTQGGYSVDDVGDDAVHPEDLVAFVSSVARFIGTEYVNIPEIVHITSEADRQRINNFCRPFRPTHRLDKEFCGQFGLLLPDATLLPETLLVPDLQHQLTPGDTFAVDIKPKQGWMLQDIEVEVAAATSSSAVGPPRTSFFKPFNLKASTRCRYCAMQFSKLRSRKVSRLSAYCPIDMFSGNPIAMRKSLDALLECPQNNLRIFRNGQLIYGNQTGSVTLEQLKMNTFNGDLTTFQDVIINSLLRNYTGKVESEKSSVLERILNIQLLAKNYVTHPCHNKTSTTTTAKRKTFKWLKKFLAKAPTAKLEDLTPHEQYLLAATFLDCSIIVAFKEIHHNNSIEILDHPNVIHLSGKMFITKVTVLDLDPKPDNHFEKFIKNTNNAYECAEEDQ